MLYIDSWNKFPTGVSCCTFPDSATQKQPTICLFSKVPAWWRCKKRATPSSKKPALGKRPKRFLKKNEQKKSKTNGSRIFTRFFYGDNFNDYFYLSIYLSIYFTHHISTLLYNRTYLTISSWAIHPNLVWRNGK
jgi:hypothetical protein